MSDKYLYAQISQFPPPSYQGFLQVKDASVSSLGEGDLLIIDQQRFEHKCEGGVNFAGSSRAVEAVMKY